MIRVYLDTKFISALKVKLRSAGNFSLELDYYRSLYKFLSTNKKNELFLAENKVKVSSNELQSMIMREGVLPMTEIEIKDYVVNENYDFNTDDKLIVLIFIDLPRGEIDLIESRKGIFVSNPDLCSSKWKNISLNTVYAKTISISFRDYQNKDFDFDKVLTNYNYHCNSILIVDRYLRGWSKRTILKNLIPLIESTVPNIECDKLSITIITSEKSDTTYRLSPTSLYNFIKKELEVIYNCINLSFIVVLEDTFLKQEKIQVQNIMHDRHLMTNYVHLSSLHSFDINGDSGVKKDTEINVKSLLESSHFSNMLRKRKSYNELLENIIDKPNSFVVCGHYQENLHFKDI